MIGTTDKPVTVLCGRLLATAGSDCDKLPTGATGMMPADCTIVGLSCMAVVAAVDAVDIILKPPSPSDPGLRGIIVSMGDIVETIGLVKLEPGKVVGKLLSSTITVFMTVTWTTSVVRLEEINPFTDEELVAVSVTVAVIVLVVEGSAVTVIVLGSEAV